MGKYDPSDVRAGPLFSVTNYSEFSAIVHYPLENFIAGVFQNVLFQGHPWLSVTSGRRKKQSFELGAAGLKAGGRFQILYCGAGRSL